MYLVTVAKPDVVVTSSVVAVLTLASDLLNISVEYFADQELESRSICLISGCCGLDEGFVEAIRSATLVNVAAPLSGWSSASIDDKEVLYDGAVSSMLDRFFFDPPTVTVVVEMKVRSFVDGGETASITVLLTVTMINGTMVPPHELEEDVDDAGLA